MLLIRLYYILSWLCLGAATVVLATLLRSAWRLELPARAVALLLGGSLIIHVEAILTWSLWLDPLPRIVLRSAVVVPLALALLLTALPTSGFPRPSRASITALAAGFGGLTALGTVAPDRADLAAGVAVVTLATVGWLAARGRSELRNPLLLLWLLLVPILVLNAFPPFWRPKLAALLVTTGLNLQAVLLLRHLLRDPRHLEEQFGLATPKYRTTPLRPDEASAILGQLRRVMEEEGGYLDSGLSLQSLATRVGCAPHQLSQVLNGTLGVNFNEYVNGFRVRRVCRALDQAPDARVLALAYDAGFASKGAFNAAFKKETGMTPREYRQRGGSSRERPE